MKVRKWMVLAGVAVALVAVLALVPAVLAQGPAGWQGFGDGGGPVGDGPFGPAHGRGPGSGPRGGMFGFGGPQNSPIAIAADVLGMDRVDLMNELRSGETVADVASEQGVALQTIVEAIMAPRQEHLAELVEAGRLTQEEADELLATMEEHITARLTEPWSPAGHGPGAGAGFVDEDGDGVCDNMGSGFMGRHGGRGGRWGR